MLLNLMSVINKLTLQHSFVIMDIVSSPSASPAAPQSLFKKRVSKSSAAIRKRLATPPLSKDSDSSFEDSSAEEGQQKIKRRRTNGVVTAVSEKVSKYAIADLEPTKYSADRSGQIDSVNDATKQSNWFDEEKLNVKSLLGKARARPNTNSPHPTASGDNEDGLYKGSSKYANFITKNPNAPTRQVGPLKAPTNIRTITVTDFAPDVCKDYKQTGFCGFGDSCKFLHAREDYKQGWELDRDWEIGTKGKRQQRLGTRRKNEGDDEDDDAALEGIPFACIICKEPYTSPIITRCGHYFCEKCALQRYRKNPACAACGTGTGGVFNIAKNLKKLLDKKRERAKRKREKALMKGEKFDDDDDGDDEEDEDRSGGNEN